MKNKLLLLALTLTFSSCGIFKTTNAPKVSSAEVEEVKEIDSTAKFIGKYDITVFGVPDVGELELMMNVTRDDGNELKTEIPKLWCRPCFIRTSWGLNGTGGRT